MICPKCGHEAKPTDRFCVACATKLEPAVEAQEAAEAAADAIESIDESIESAEENVDRAFEEEAAAIVDEAEQTLGAIEQKPAGYVPPVAAAPIPEMPQEKTAEVDLDMKAVKQAEKEAKQAEKEAKAAERAEIREAESNCKALSTWGFVWRIFLVLIPILNIIPLFVFAFASGINKNSRSFARAVLIYILIGVLLLLAGGAALFILFNGQDVIENVRGWLVNLLSK